jgi:hypothetical protein
MGPILLTNRNIFIERKIKEFSDFIPRGCRSSPSYPYRKMVGGLMYAMVSTRPDLAYSLSVVSRFLSCPTQTHCELVSHIYMYVRGTLDFKIRYEAKSNLELTGYVDAAYGNNKRGTSTTGYCFLVGDGLISWYSKGQKVVALSIAEAKYIAATEAAKEAIWLRTFLEELGFPQKSTVLFEDNQACILLSRNPQLHSRTKHIQIRYHFIREKVSSKEITLQYISTKDQLADMFKKSLPGYLLRLKNFNCLVYFNSRGELELETHRKRVSNNVKK